MTLGHIKRSPISSWKSGSSIKAAMSKASSPSSIANGYDHIEPDEAKEMFGIQGKVLEEYGLPLYPDQLDVGRGK